MGLSTVSGNVFDGSLRNILKLFSYILISVIASLRLGRVLDQAHAHHSTRCWNYCAGTANDEVLKHQFTCGDRRLGPRHLQLSTLFSPEYERFGHLCPGDFLQAWYNWSIQSYNYPPSEGFQIDISGAPIRHTINLTAGAYVDRFGPPHGYFLSPVGTPYAQRALPPSVLNLNPETEGYHRYRVEKSFAVDAGPVMSWFGQPGQSLQYRLFQNISDLMVEGYLAMVVATNMGWD